MKAITYLQNKTLAIDFEIYRIKIYCKVFDFKLIYK